MTDVKLTEMTELTVPIGTDMIYVVDDPGGTPLSRKCQIANLAGAIGISFCGASAKRTTDQTISTETWTAVTLDSENYDTSAIHDNSTNPSRFTIPTGKGGYWSMKAQVQWYVNGTGERYIGFRVNGNPVALSVAGYYRTAAYYITHISLDWQLTAGQYVECFVYQDSGGDLAVKAANVSVAFMGA